MYLWYSHFSRPGVICYVATPFDRHYVQVFADTNGLVWRSASHTVIIVLCTKLDAECNRQTTVIGRLMTTLGDDQCAVTKLFSVQRLGKSSRENALILGDTQMSYSFDKYFPTSGGFSCKPKALGPVEAHPWTLCIGSKSHACSDCIDLPPEVRK